MRGVSTATVVYILLSIAAGCEAPAPELREQAAAVSEEHPHDQVVNAGCRDSVSLPRVLVTREGVGPARMGMTRADLVRQCPAVSDTTLFDAEGVEVPASTLRVAGADVGFVEWSGRGRIEKIRVVSPVAMTDKGIRVGSTLGDLRRVHSRLSMGYDDAGVYVWDPGMDGLSYLLAVRATNAMLVPDDVASRPGLVPDSSRIRSILIFEDSAP